MLRQEMQKIPICLPAKGLAGRLSIVFKPKIKPISSILNPILRANKFMYLNTKPTPEKTERHHILRIFSCRTGQSSVDETEVFDNKRNSPLTNSKKR